MTFVNYTIALIDDNGIESKLLLINSKSGVFRQKTEWITEEIDIFYNILIQIYEYTYYSLNSVIAF